MYSAFLAVQNFEFVWVWRIPVRLWRRLRLTIRFYLIVGLPGIEPGLRAPHARVLPIYYSPYRDIILGTMKRTKRKGGRRLTASVHIRYSGLG